MKCPQCNQGISPTTKKSDLWYDDEEGFTGHRLAFGHRPECGELIVLLERGNIYPKPFDDKLDVAEETIIYPPRTFRKVDSEIPQRYRDDFYEAGGVLGISPKASAALSRRILQDVLREKFNINKRNLADEIEEFINLPGIPSHLVEAVDAVRNIGNFAAHPLKDTNTGEIVDVEPGEAEWLLDVLDALFDFAFVQPKRLEERKNNLNRKLLTMGKPPMK